MIGGREPVLIRTSFVAAVAAVIHVLVMLGVINLEQDAETAIVAAVDIIAAFVIVLLVRPMVTPVADPTLTPKQLGDLSVVDERGDLLPYTVVSDGRDSTSVKLPGQWSISDNDGGAGIPPKQSYNGSDAYMSKADRELRDHLMRPSSVGPDQSYLTQAARDAADSAHLTDAELNARRGYTESPRLAQRGNHTISEDGKLIVDGKITEARLSPEGGDRHSTEPQFGHGTPDGPMMEVDETPPPEGYTKRH